MADARTAGIPVSGDEDPQVMTGEAVGLDLRPTPWVLAAAGAAIDFIVYVVVAFGVLELLLVIMIAADPTGGATDGDAITAVLVATLVTMFIVVPLVVELLSKGKSLGRLAVGARIVRDDGGAIGFRHAFIRSLIGAFEIFVFLGGLAALVGLFGTRTKRLGDLLAGTYSQYERVSKAPELAFGVPTELIGWSQTADVARIPNRLAIRMSQFLRQSAQLSPIARETLSRQLANEASAFVSPIPQVHPELFLAAVIAMRRDREFTALRLENERLEHLEPALTGLPHGFPERG